MYTIKELADLAGVTTRTLRYYDQIDLLKPSYLNSAGYRMYEKKEVDMLQQILFFREMELPLATIKDVLSQPNVNILTLLEQHREVLVSKQQRLQQLVTTIDQTIQYQKGELTMSDEEKFQAFKENLITENEERYGEEAREKYGATAIEQTHAKIKEMSEEAYTTMQKTEQALFSLLQKDWNIPSDDAKKVMQLHREWLNNYWVSYSSEQHKGLVEMYLTTDEFVSYYDQKAGAGATQKLHDAVCYYA